MQLVVTGERVVFPDGVRSACVCITDGRIVAIRELRDRPAGVAVFDAGDLVVLPGLVDTHVHINDPGRAEWEGFEHATRAAAAGGITTMVDMPLNCIPATTSVAALEMKRRTGAGRCYVDVAFWGGVVPANVNDLEPLARAGVLGFKCFLSPSGVPEFGHVTERDLREALPVLAELRLPLLAHAEWPPMLRDIPPNADPKAYSTWLESRPAASEHAAIDLLIRLAREYGVRVHIVHLASADAISNIVKGRAAGVPLSVETCPHYLTFAADEIPDGATAYKCAPPIRERRHRDGLWQALVDGHIDLVATDHSPSPPDLKRLDDGDFVAAWGGIASVQIGLAAVWTGAAARGIAFEHVARWMAAAPAALAGLTHVKGSITVGAHADLVVWDADAGMIVDRSSLYHRHPVTPYHGLHLRGAVRATMLRGEIVCREGEFVGAPFGQFM